MKFLLEIDLEKLGNETLSNTIHRLGFACKKLSINHGEYMEIKTPCGSVIGHCMVSEADYEE